MLLPTLRVYSAWLENSSLPAQPPSAYRDGEKAEIENASADAASPVSPRCESAPRGWTSSADAAALLLLLLELLFFFLSQARILFLSPISSRAEKDRSAGGRILGLLPRTSSRRRGAERAATPAAEFQSPGEDSQRRGKHRISRPRVALTSHRRGAERERERESGCARRGIPTLRRRLTHSVGRSTLGLLLLGLLTVARCRAAAPAERKSPATDGEDAQRREKHSRPFVARTSHRRRGAGGGGLRPFRLRVQPIYIYIDV